MIVWIAIGVLLVVAFILLSRGFVGADPRALARVMRWILVALGAMLGIFLLATGRLVPALVDATVLAMLFVRWKQMWNMMRASLGPSRGQSSGVETAYLRMQLDHDSGAMDGTVAAGAFAGRMLSAMSLAELTALLAECAASDPPSVPLIEAYLDRAHGPEWRQGGAGGAGGVAAAASGKMTVDEARQVLGVGPDATDEEIEHAYRGLMRKVHPDQGGSTYLASKLNQARDTLVEKH